jgi:hypothetical protein
MGIVVKYQNKLNEGKEPRPCKQKEIRKLTPFLLGFSAPLALKRFRHLSCIVQTVNKISSLNTTA